MNTKGEYIAEVELQNTMLKAILNIGGDKTKVSRKVAWDRKWEVEIPLDGKSFGIYFPRWKPTKYFGHILGPLLIRFDPKNCC